MQCNGRGEVVIAGVKVYLRPIIKEDLGVLNQWRNDENTFKYLGGGFMPLSIDYHAKLLESMMDTTGSNKRFIICDKKDAPVGMVGLYDINWIHRTCEIGVYLGDKNAQGKGYGKEACQLLEHFASNYLNIRKIKVCVVSNNEMAISMWKSLGYQKIGERVKERYIMGEYRNLVLMEKFTETN